MNLKTKILTAVTALILGAAFTFNAGAISTDLHKAVKDGNIEKVRELCEIHPEWVDKYDVDYFYPITWAENEEIIKCLVEYGASANAALYGISAKGLSASAELIRYLAEHGANLELCLTYAVHMNYLDLVEYLTGHGANPNDGLTTAFYEDKLDLFKYFAEHGANKELALDYAISGNNIDLVKYLVEKHGAYASEGLFRAVGTNCSGVDNTDVLEYLVRHGADVNDGFAFCFMDEANFKLAKWFIDHGADVNMDDGDGNTILHASVKYLHDTENSTKEYPYLTEDYVKHECEKARAIIDFLRANGAHE